MKLFFRRSSIGLFILFASIPALAAELYLPLQLDPAIEAKVEKALIQADMSIIKRPIAVGQLRAALQKIQNQDPTLTATLKRYLKRFEKRAGLDHASLKISASSGADHPVANQRGLDTGSSFSTSFSVHLKAGNWLAASIGGVAYDSADGKDEFAEGSFLSIGNSYFQADIGYRPHWFGPFQESDMLRSTNASATPGITLSNTKPISRFGFRYEIFFAEMSQSDLVLSKDRDERLAGKPRLFGFHASTEPLPGFSLSANRLMQYGGANRDDSLASLTDAFIDARNNDNIGAIGRDFGNQATSFATRFTFSGERPIAIYMEYGGEDTSKTSKLHLGNTALMLGIHAPKLTNALDLSYEFAQWQNGWYVNSNYGDGLRQHEAIIGHWGASNRVFHEAVGATTHQAKLVYYIGPKKTLVSRYHQVSNDQYGTTQYETAYGFESEYMQEFSQFSAGLGIEFGNDVFGDAYSQLSGVLKW